MNKKRMGILLLILSTMSNNIYGLSLIDNMDYIDKKIEISQVIEENKNQSTIIHDNVIIKTYPQKSWNNYVLKNKYKYLINESVLHEFNQDGEYKRTIKQSKVMNGYKSPVYLYESKDVDLLKTEKERYIQSGFTDIPSLHVSTIRDDVSYFNQWENIIKPEISCVPTVTAMFLHVQGIKELIPDDISERTPFSSSGSSTDDVLRSLSYTYPVKNKTYNWDFTSYSIKNYINKGNPIMSYIKAGYVDYYHLFENEAPYNRYNRRYYITNFAEATYSHAILITGYMEIEGITYLEIYDPVSTNNVWIDGKPTPNGKGKFMTYDEFKKINNGSLIYFETGPYKVK